MPGAKNAGVTRRRGIPVVSHSSQQHLCRRAVLGMPLAHPETPREPLLASLCKSRSHKEVPNLGQSRTRSKSKPD